MPISKMTLADLKELGVGRMKHHEIRNKLLEVGFEDGVGHLLNRGTDKVYLCGSCYDFKHFKNDVLVKELRGKNFSKVETYLKTL